MAFPVTGAYDSGVCPESHPIAIQSVFTEFFYNNRQIAPENFNKWVYAQGDGIGYGLRKCDPSTRLATLWSVSDLIS